MRKAFAYLRVSGRGQIDGDGFPRQLEAIHLYAKTNGIRVMKVFREEGVTGAADITDRPAFLEMMEALLANGTRLVVVEKLGRLARDLMILETILGDLQKRGIGTGVCSGAGPMAPKVRRASSRVRFLGQSASTRRP
jgi:site-specific DNA recombinase